MILKKVNIKKLSPKQISHYCMEIESCEQYKFFNGNNGCDMPSILANKKAKVFINMAHGFYKSEYF